MIVRSIVHAMGYRYRLHDRSLPGKPDLVFRAARKVIFVHGASGIVTGVDTVVSCQRRTPSSGRPSGRATSIEIEGIAASFKRTVAGFGDLGMLDT